MVNLDLLSSVGRVTQFSKNSVVFYQNDQGDCMYIALRGRFGVYINSFSDFPVRVASIENGSFFGEMSIIDGWPRSATIIAEEDAVALYISKDNFEMLLRKSPELTEIMLSSLRNRALAAIGTVRSAGKSAPDLPLSLMKAAPSDDAKRAYGQMVILAKKIRELNDLLSSPTAAPASPDEQQAANAIKLLPAGYKWFDKADKNDNKGMLQLKKSVCPYCLSEADVYIPLFSNLVPKQHTFDQRVIYDNFDILWYTNIVCPSCYYTDTYQEFTKFRLYSAADRQTRNRFLSEERFTGFATTHKHTLDEVIQSYYLNIACIGQTINDTLRLAKAWVRLYWIYSDNNSPDFARQSAVKAQEYYIEYLRDNDSKIGTEDKMRFNAILTELSIALGNLTGAREYLKDNINIGRFSNSDLLRQSLLRYKDIKEM